MVVTYNFICIVFSLPSLALKSYQPTYIHTYIHTYLYTYIQKTVTLYSPWKVISYLIFYLYNFYFDFAYNENQPIYIHIYIRLFVCIQLEKLELMVHMKNKYLKMYCVSVIMQPLSLSPVFSLLLVCRFSLWNFVHVL